eukprot:3339823-Pyramimonas_sp.AAC.1
MKGFQLIHGDAATPRQTRYFPSCSGCFACAGVGGQFSILAIGLAALLECTARLESVAWEVGLETRSSIEFAARAARTTGG